MKALVQDIYGPSEVLRLEDVDRPEPAAGEELVRITAASVNAADWHLMRGEPRIARLMDRGIFGRKGPRERIRGRDPPPRGRARPRQDRRHDLSDDLRAGDRRPRHARLRDPRFLEPRAALRLACIATTGQASHLGVDRQQRIRFLCAIEPTS